MNSVLLAESAVLAGFHSVGMSLLILGQIVIALLALCTCQCNLCSHDLFPPNNLKSNPAYSSGKISSFVRKFPAGYEASGRKCGSTHVKCDFHSKALILQGLLPFETTSVYRAVSIKMPTKKRPEVFSLLV